MGHVTKNYMGNGGEEWVVGGKLTILPGAEVSGLDGANVTQITPAASVGTLENNAQVSDLIEAFNVLVVNLKAAGLMAE